MSPLFYVNNAAMSNKQKLKAAPKIPDTGHLFHDGSQNRRHGNQT